MRPARSVSMKDVARLAQVSVGTVSNVLNAPDRVTAPTRIRVEEAIEKLGWVPNESARQLRAGRSRSIGMVIMDIANPFFTDVVKGTPIWDRSRGDARWNSPTFCAVCGLSEADIAADDSAARILVIPANEELVLAREVFRKLS